MKGFIPAPSVELRGFVHEEGFKSPSSTTPVAF